MLDQFVALFDAIRTGFDVPVFIADATAQMATASANLGAFVVGSLPKLFAADLSSTTVILPLNTAQNVFLVDQLQPTYKPADLSG